MQRTSIDAYTEAEAISTLAQRTHGVQVLHCSPGIPEVRVEASAATEEEAFRIARSQIPGDGLAKAEWALAAAKQEDLVLTGFRESEVRDAANSKATSLGMRLDTLSMEAPGKKGLFGLGRVPNTYKVRLVSQATVVVSYYPKQSFVLVYDMKEDPVADVDSKDVSSLFDGDGDRSWNALRNLKERKLSAQELEQVCAMLMMKNGYRAPIALLDKVGTAACLPALLSRMYSAVDTGIKVLASRAAASIIKRDAANVSTTELEILHEIDDSQGLTTYQSDYSWDQGTTESEIASFEELRKAAAEILKARR
jgi:hypothetical protein